MGINTISREEAIQTLPILSQSARAATEDAGENHAIGKVADDFRVEILELARIFPGNERVTAALNAIEPRGLSWESFQQFADHVDALADELTAAA